METKLLQLGELLYAIQDIQEKMQLQLQELEENYFCYIKSVGNYSRARVTCSIASDYSRNLDYALEEALEVVERLIKESGNVQKGGVA